MTRITFLIGNGFDLNVGLDTRYKDFYDYYTAKYPDDILAAAIGKNYLYWSDLELGLGRYTEQVKIEDEESFWESEENLEQELATFLEGQMNRIKIDDNEKELETALEMQRSLTEFYAELPKNFQQHINNIFDHIREQIMYSFISFNYTNVLDQCLNVTRKVIPTADFVKHKCNGGLIYTHLIDEVLHIHGTTDNQMILGVNDETQITNKEFIKNSLAKQILIKEETIRRYDADKIQQAHNIIDDSIIICVFGMSIGRTDKMWWKYLCQWLQGDKERLLIIYIKIKNTDGKKRIGKRTLFGKQDELLKRLKNNADLPDADWHHIESQIYVNCNTNIFNFKIVDK